MYKVSFTYNLNTILLKIFNLLDVFNMRKER